ncbi:PQ-loop repeat-containing protein 1 [Podila humilis]|nr:PQ-loop repeat-containing protein 1 [Podila humilis]
MSDPTEPMPWNIFRISMVIGPVTGYFHQYYTMYRMKTSMGFSSVTCGVLIISSIFRIYFCFDDALLYQSILMTVVQLFLLELCVRYYPWTVQIPAPVTHSNPSRINPALAASTHASSTPAGGPTLITTRASRIQSSGWYKDHAFYWNNFWNWSTIAPYYLFLAGFTVVIGLSLLIIGKTPFFVELLGLAALGIEATVPLPQAIQNYRSKSTAGFSPAILLMWVIGDSVKTYYYIITHAKYQFIGCGVIQLCIDCVIIFQTFIYSRTWRDFKASARGGSLQDHVGTGRSSEEALLGREEEED